MALRGGYSCVFEELWGGGQYEAGLEIGGDYQLEYGREGEPGADEVGGLGLLERREGVFE